MILKTTLMVSRNNYIHETSYFLYLLCKAIPYLFRKFDKNQIGAVDMYFNYIYNIYCILTEILVSRHLVAITIERSSLYALLTVR